MLKYIWIISFSYFVTCLHADDTQVAGTTSSLENQCYPDKQVTDVCLQCNSLALNQHTSLATCCTDTFIFHFCQLCLNNEDSCHKLITNVRENSNKLLLADDDTGKSKEANADTEVDEKRFPGNLQQYTNTDETKRFGKLFSKSPTLFGKIMAGKRNELQQAIDADTGKENLLLKKFGLISVRSGNGEDFDKRFGKLYMKANKYFG